MVSLNREEALIACSKTVGELTSSLRTQLEKVFLPPGTCFLRRNFPNIEEEFS